jgi:RNA polymerase sigma-70 factor (ECF subfamily)
MTMHSSDGELVTAILGGATERFGELVRRYDRRVRATVAERVRGRQVREELVHQAFYRAFRSLGQLEDPERFEAWLVRIAARCCTDHLRERAGRDGREQPLEGSEVRGTNETDGWIWEEVQRLPRALAEVLVLRYRARCSYREIAERLRLPESTIRGRIYEARRALRQRLELDDGTRGMP